MTTLWSNEEMWIEICNSKSVYFIKVFYFNQKYQMKLFPTISPRWQNLLLSLSVCGPSLKPTQLLYYGAILQSQGYWQQVWRKQTAKEFKNYREQIFQSPMSPWNIESNHSALPEMRKQASLCLWWSSHAGIYDIIDLPELSNRRDSLICYAP